MIYCVADMHGMYSKFLKLLKQIDLQEDDILYVLGDVCDRGAYSMQVLLRMMEYDNIIPICGNHDFMAAKCLKLLSREITDESVASLTDWELGMLNDWLGNGGEPTLNNFTQLSQEQKEDILDYFSEFNFYEEVTINGQDYILVHAGLGDFDPNKPLEDYDIDQLIDTRPDYSRRYYENKIVVSGHTPTQSIEENLHPGRIYKGNNHIAIDCGCYFGGPLAAICLDTGEEFYIE